MIKPEITPEQLEKTLKNDHNRVYIQMLERRVRYEALAVGDVVNSSYTSSHKKQPCTGECHLRCVPGILFESIPHFWHTFLETSTFLKDRCLIRCRLAARPFTWTYSLC